MVALPNPTRGRVARGQKTNDKLGTALPAGTGKNLENQLFGGMVTRVSTCMHMLEQSYPPACAHAKAEVTF
jgi:hypothetical protein